MRRTIVETAALLICLALVAQPTCAQDEAFLQHTQVPMSYEIPKLMNPADGLLVGGQPTQQALHRLAADGYGVVINLRGLEEFDGYDEPNVAEALGMAYYAIPVSGAGDLSLENVRQLDQILASHADSKILVHCASGNRVGALFALRAAWLHNRSPEQALDAGRVHGLSGLAPQVETLLKQNSNAR